MDWPAVETHVQESEPDDEEVFERLASALGDELSSGSGGSTRGDQVTMAGAEESSVQGRN